MIPQHLSNCLWACLQLENEAPEIVVLAIMAEIPGKIKEMVPHCSTAWTALSFFRNQSQKL